MSEQQPADPRRLDVIAREQCAKILSSRTAKLLPRDKAEALVIIAFTYGAAWALEDPRIRTIGDAQMEALRSAKQ